MAAELNAEQIDQEMLPFLSLSSRPDVRCIAMQYFLGLTGTTEGKQFIASNDKYFLAIINVLEDNQLAIAKDAYLSLVNLTTSENISWKILSEEPFMYITENLIKYVLKCDSCHADIACSILSNASRSERCAKRILDIMVQNPDIGIDKVIEVFCRIDHNKHANLNYIGSFLANLTQIQAARLHILDKEKCVIQRLLPYTHYSGSKTRRGGVISTLKNCCFETDYHEWLLSPEIDLLPRLLLPLAGPEEFDEEDTEKLPEELQYLEPGKQREPDPDLRKMLVEAVLKLMTTKPCRQYIRDKNTYVILRELDNWETDPECTMVIRNAISVLISDEPEPGMEDLDSVEIPEAVHTKLVKAQELMKRDLEEEASKMSLEEQTS